jgi:hypothetical protein
MARIILAVQTQPTSAPAERVFSRASQSTVCVKNILCRPENLEYFENQGKLAEVAELAEEDVDDNKDNA